MNKLQFKYTSIVLQQVLTFKQPTDVVLSHFFQKNAQLGRQDRHEITETIFAVLRHYQKICFMLPKFDINKAILAALIFGRNIKINQIIKLFEDGDDEFLAKCENTQSLFSQHLNTAAELPQWLIDLMKSYLSEQEILDFGKSMMDSAPLDVRVNTFKNKRAVVFKKLSQEFNNIILTPYSPIGLRFNNKYSLNKNTLYLDGSIEIQDEGSQLLALLVDAKRNEIIVDFCAGAGGKTLVIGANMANKGRIYAFDTSEKRLENLKPRMIRAGLTNIHIQKIENENDIKIKRLLSKADKVLVDVPCSGLGTLRRNPDLKYRQSDETIEFFLNTQLNILQSASTLVKPNGYLIYATCSILPQENEYQIEKFLQMNSSFQLIDASQILKKNKINLNTGVYLKLNTSTHKTDGFFAAILQKKNSL